MHVAGNVHRSKHLYVHCPDSVIIGPVSTAVAYILMGIVMPVLLEDPPAFGTSLGGVVGVHLKDIRSRSMCFVCQVLLQLVERPGPQILTLSAVAAAERFSTEAYSGKVLNHKKRICAVSVNECL